MLKGKIELDSQKGVGSTFTLSLMIDNADTLTLHDPNTSLADRTVIRELHPPRKQTESKPLDGMRILVAEDGHDNQRLISFILKKAGAIVEMVENGKLASDKAAAAKEDGSPYDVVLMDMQMPVMDGYTATRKLRGEGYNLPVIALTAHAMAEDRQKCLDAGCDEFTTKPIDRSKLIDLISRFATATASTSDDNES